MALTAAPPAASSAVPEISDPGPTGLPPVYSHEDLGRRLSALDPADPKAEPVTIALARPPEGYGRPASDEVAALGRLVRDAEATEEGCLRVVHVSSVSAAGIPRISLPGGRRTVLVSRLSFAVSRRISLHGLDRSGLSVLHVCGDPLCIRAAHLRPGTSLHAYRRRRARGEVLPAVDSAARSHCPRGHRLAGNNLSPTDLGLGRRRCYLCARARNAVTNAKARGEVLDFSEALRREIVRDDVRALPEVTLSAFGVTSARVPSDAV